MSDEPLVTLGGFNPDGVRGVVIRPTDDMAVYVVPDRALEVLDVLVDGRPVMYRNPAGHRSWRSWRSGGLNPLAHIEAAFTGGLENVGAPNGPLPLHGTFSVTPAAEWELTPTGGVRGRVDCRRMVVGPGIIVERSVEPVPGRRAFKYVDRLRAEVGSDYMWLYHPNFPVAEGTRFVSSETLVVPRPDDIARWGLKTYRVFENVGRGHCRFPPGTDAASVEEENFEQCFIMRVLPDGDGVVRAMLVAPDGESAGYVEYDTARFHDVQQAFQLWKNPRDGACGLEVGSCFMGWQYAAEHGLLCRLGQGEEHTYEIEIGFLRGRAEVDAFRAEMPDAGEPELKTVDAEGLAAVYKG